MRSEELGPEEEARLVDEVTEHRNGQEVEAGIVTQSHAFQLEGEEDDLLRKELAEVALDAVSHEVIGPNVPYNPFPADLEESARPGTPARQRQFVMYDPSLGSQRGSNN